MQKWADAIAEWLVRCSVIEKGDKKLYSYAVYSFLLFWLPVFLALLFGSIMGAVKQSILLIFPFMMIRKFSGGYHASRLSVCLVCSSLLLYLCILVACRIPASAIVIFVTLTACLSLIIFSPIEHQNRILNSKEKIAYKKVTGIFVGGFYIAVLLLKFIGFEREAVCISVGILLTAGLQVPCIVKKIIRK